MHEVKKINCLVVDDEPAACDVVVRYIRQLPIMELAGECSNAMQAITFLQQEHVDLLFLDIHMPQLNGTDLLKVLKNPPKTIFTTAHEQYALQSYELDAIDYLLKPIQFDRFLKAVQKAMQMQLLTPTDVQPASASSGQETFIYLRAERKMVKVFLKDILYVESMKDYVKVFTTNGLVVSKMSISALEDLLPEHHFVRTHRSFIVSLQRIKSYTSELVEIEKTEVPIGKLYRNTVLKALG